MGRIDFSHTLGHKRRIVLRWLRGISRDFDSDEGRSTIEPTTSKE
jgi:hypothetical protein